MSVGEASRGFQKHPSWRIWTNPIFLRYCRSRLRVGSLAVWLLMTLLFTCFIFFLARNLGIYQQGMDVIDASRQAFIPIFVLQALILFIFGTAHAAGGITAEADEGVIDYQRLIPMTPLSKVLGYLFGLPVREYVLFLSTLPFTAWIIWEGEIQFMVWFPLYTVFMTSAWLYHLTGLLTGTVVKNRRWAFLVSMGIVFCLYTIIPQFAKFGLIFFKYLTVTPTFMESIPHIIPRDTGEVVELVSRLMPSVKFFNLKLPESVFTIFTQGGLILTFIVMLCRHWKRKESQLMGKSWAVGFFIWVQILLLGNALPSIDSGTLFASRQVSRIFREEYWAPTPGEAVFMSGMYGVVTLFFMLILVGIITPSLHRQMQGWRRTIKLGLKRLPFREEASSAFAYVFLMAVTGAIGWSLFTQGLVESRWYPGHTVDLSICAGFLLVMLAGGMSYHALLEAKGRRLSWLVVIIVVFVPMLVGTVVGVISSKLIPLAAWIGGISPLSLPIYASFSLLSLHELPIELSRALPRAYYFWQFVLVIVSLSLIYHLFQARRAIAKEAGEKDEEGRVKEEGNAK